MLTEKDVPQAVEELRATFNSGHTRSAEWRKGQLRAFMRMLKEGRDEISDALFQDLHKNPAESFFSEIGMCMGEVDHMLHDLDELMAPVTMPTDSLNMPGWSYQYKDPLGLVLVIGAWNYPFLLTMQPVVGAIAAGNTVLIKVPSQHYSGATSKAMVNLVTKYLDNSAVKIAYGDREMTQEVLKHRYDIIFYTGGGYVGQMVAEAAAKNLTPTILELGGKSPCVVDKTAGSIDVAARRTAWGFCGLNNGQTCVRPDYALVHADVAEEFLTKVEANIKQWYGGNARTSDSYGRIINQRAAVRLQSIIEADKAYVRFGGESNPDEKFVEPTCMDFKEDFAAFTKSKSMEDEIFGPILPVFRYRNLDDAIKFINSNEKPLALYAFTGDTNVREKILTETTSGGVSINDCVVHLANPNLPFGGVGKSGMGSYHGKRSFDSFSHVKSVLVKTNYLDAPQRYPPYKEDPMLQAFLTPLDEDKKSVFKKLMYAAIAGAAYKVIRSKL